MNFFFLLFLSRSLRYLFYCLQTEAKSVWPEEPEIRSRVVRYVKFCKNAVLGKYQICQIFYLVMYITDIIAFFSRFQNVQIGSNISCFSLVRSYFSG